MTPRPRWHILFAGLLILSASSTYAFYARVLPVFRINYSPAVILTALAVALILLPLVWSKPARRWVGVLLGVDEADLSATCAAPAGSSAWFWFGLAFVTAMFVLLEVRQPFYFTQDDNSVQFLPVIVQGCREAFHGTFPNWNPYQYMGSPTAALGVYSLTYPFTYLIYWFCRDVLRNEYLTLEAFAIFHLLVGYAAAYWAARCCRVRPSMAVIAGITPVLSGFALIGSRSWYYMSPTFLYVPLLVVCLARLQGAGLKAQGAGEDRNKSQRMSWKWIVATGVLIGLYFHAGNAQMWVYAMVFFVGVAGVSALAGGLPWARIAAVIAALLIGAAISAPLLIPQMELTRDVDRPMHLFNGRVSPPNYMPVIVPGGWFYANTPLDWTGNDYLRASELAYSGTLATLAALLALATWYAYRWDRKIGRRNLWLLCAVIAFMSAAGSRSPLWLLMGELPGFDKFRVAFKFLAFFNVFVALAGVIVLERVLRELKSARAWERIIVAASCAILVAHCWICDDAFYRYHYTPYPKLDGAVEALLRPASGTPPRIVTITPKRSIDPDYWRALPHELASVYRVSALDGYDPLVELDPYVMQRDDRVKAAPLAMLARYGVRYAVVSALSRHRVWSEDPGAHELEYELSAPKSVVKAAEALGPPVYADRELSIYKVPGAVPLAFAETAPEVALPLEEDGSGVKVDTSSLTHGGEVVVNMLWRPQYRVWAGKARIASKSDGFGRMVVDIPPGTAEVSVRFVPPWLPGIVMGLVLLAVAGVLTLALERRSKAESGTAESMVLAARS